MDASKPKKKKSLSFAERFSNGILLLGKNVGPCRRALHIAGIYMLIGVIWILFSDKALLFIATDREMQTNLGILKGWIYVLITGLIICVLIYSALKRIHADNERLIGNYQELEAAHQNLSRIEEDLLQQYQLLMESQKKLADSEERYKLIAEASNDGIWDYDLRTHEKYFSQRWYEMLGYTAEDITGDIRLIHPDDREKVVKVIEEHITRRTPCYICEYRIKTKSGGYKWVLAKGKALFDEDGNVYRMAGANMDITDLKKSRDELHHLAYYDQLTGLPNRLSLSEDMARKLKNCPDYKLALLFLDIDNFKMINDTLGHVLGDQLIKLAGERLVTLSDSGNSIYHLGGDEFVVLLESVKDSDEIRAFADRILDEFCVPFSLEGSILHVSVSFGIAVFPEHGATMDELLRCADLAMYKAKSEGRSCYIIYHESMMQTVRKRMDIEERLRTALERNEFELYYQPQYRLESQRLAGFEALLRWNNPDLGMVSPLDFIKIAEETRLIIPLGRWVLQNACRFLQRLHQRGLEDLTVAVNVSILQLLQNDFSDWVLETIAQYGLKPRDLEVEVTESVLMVSYDSISGNLETLDKQGVGIALDDFGTGYSSLSYLTQMPISSLKIDKSFINGISPGKDRKSLVGQIVMLGQSMGMSVVAEGVETQEQLDYLARFHCDKIQGYLFSKPLPEDRAEELAIRLRCS